jgi:hypothetical protein
MESMNTLHLNIKQQTMENSNLIIRVPEPCHEDWNKMTPETQGKFCGSCCKTVVDFSGKTDQEIKMILIENSGKKMCGHFKTTQIDRPLTMKVDLNKPAKNMSISKAFAAAVFFIFGSFLFNCKAQSNKILGRMIIQKPVVKETSEKFMMKGDVSVETIETVETETITPVTTPSPAVIESIIEEPMVNGEMTFTETPVNYKERDFVKGKVSPQYYEQHLVNKQPEEQIEEQQIVTEPDIKAVPKDSIAILPTIVEDPMMYTVGMMVWDPEPGIIDSVAKETIILPEVQEEKVEEVNVSGMEVFIFPNPSGREFTIGYEVKKRSDVIANLLDIKGAHIKNLITVSQQYEGKYRVGVDAGELPNGIYFIDLMNGDMRTVKKIVIEK